MPQRRHIGLRTDVPRPLHCRVQRNPSPIRIAPLIGRTCDEIRAGYRKHPHGAHVIYYTLPNESELLVVRILHGTMDTESNLGCWRSLKTDHLCSLKIDQG